MDIQTIAKTAKAVADEFEIDPKDFFSVREGSSGSLGTHIEQVAVAMSQAAEALNTSSPVEEREEGGYTNVVSPVVMPTRTRSWRWLIWAAVWFVAGLFGLIFFAPLGASTAFLLAHFLAVLGYVAFNVWRNSFVMIPDGCMALITKFGRVEETVGAGRKWLFHPWKRVGYVVNVTKEYPYNAPIRQAPTQERVEASVDLFLQFRIEDPNEFIFTLGGSQGFAEKLHNAISEVTRALIYEQKAEDIYDLVGESTQSLMETLNRQFLPAVRFVNANITHAEPASQEYRMDLASPELVKVAKEAYTYQYELRLRKERDEGDLNKELADLRKTLSEIRAEIATYQAQIDTAREKAINRANAYARQLMIEAESEAKANAALLEAQALDLKALNGARYPEILEYRFRQETLEKIEDVADKLPQIINVGPPGDSAVNFMEVARQMLGAADASLYTPEDMKAIQDNMQSISNRIEERRREIDQMVKKSETMSEEGVEV